MVTFNRVKNIYFYRFFFRVLFQSRKVYEFIEILRNPVHSTPDPLHGDRGTETQIDSVRQSHVGKTNFSISLHSVEKVYLGHNHNKCLQSLRMAGLSKGGGANIIFCLHASPTSVHNLRNYLRKLS